MPWRRDRLPTPVFMGFPGGSAGKASACSAGDMALIPGLGRSLGEGHGNLLQYSCLGNFHGQRSLAGLQSMRSQRVGHDWASKHTHGSREGLESSIPTEVSGLHGSEDSQFILTDVDTEQVVGWTQWWKETSSLLVASDFQRNKKWHHLLRTLEERGHVRAIKNVSFSK